MPDDAQIPSRSTEWGTPFSPVAPVNAQADAARIVRTYSAGRRVVAILVTIAAGLLVASLIVRLASVVPPTVGPDGEPIADRAPYVLLYRDIVIWTGICIAAVWGTWKWANKPVRIG